MEYLSYVLYESIRTLSMFSFTQLLTEWKNAYAREKLHYSILAYNICEKNVRGGSAEIRTFKHRLPRDSIKKW